jgi:hypothetical protein
MLRGPFSGFQPLARVSPQGVRHRQRQDPATDDRGAGWHGRSIEAGAQAAKIDSLLPSLIVAPIRPGEGFAMEIYLSKRAMQRVRLSVADAIEDGEVDALREDLISLFSDDDIEEIERRIDSGDFYDFVSEILDEWSGEDMDELMELLETQLADADIDLKYTALENDDDDDEDEEESEDEDEPEDDLIVDDAEEDI